jgi:hypothetical protein
MYALVLALVLSVACDKENPDTTPPPGGGGGGGGGNTVTEGARLGWNQTADSAPHVQSMTFRLYVDGTAMSLAAVTCGSTATGGQYDCSGRLPSMSSGRRVLELASILNGVESSRSAPLTITFNATTQLPPSEETSDSSGGAVSANVVCLEKTQRCQDSTLIASGLADVTGLSALPDGRVLFIERGTRVRVVDGTTLLAEPALSAPNGAALVGLAVDSAFDQTRFVFVASADATPSGSRLNITRYRELAGSLGEGARILTDLPFEGDAVAPLAVDSAGLLYVAVPSAVLRLTRDGTAAPNDSPGSLVIASGYSQPTSLGIDPISGRLWLSGTETGQASGVATILLNNSLSRTEQARPIAAANLTTRFAPTLTVLPRRTGEENISLLVGTDGQLLRGVVSGNGRLDPLTRLATSQALPLRAATQGADGSLYVVGGEAVAMSLLRLTDWQ